MWADAAGRVDSVEQACRDGVLLGDSPLVLSDAERADNALRRDGKRLELVPTNGVVIDGVGNRQGCLVPLREGMAVETQRGRREVGR